MASIPKLLTPEDIAKYRALGAKFNVKELNPNSDDAPTFTPDTEKDLATESTGDMIADSDAAKVGQEIPTVQPGDNIFSTLRGIVNPAKGQIPDQSAADTQTPLQKLLSSSQDQKPLDILDLARNYDTSVGGNYPNGANGFGDPSTFAKGVNVAKSKKGNRTPASKITPDASVPTPEKPALTDIDAGTGTINTRQNLADAYGAANEMTLGNTLGKVGDKILAGLTRTNPQFQDIYDQGIKEAQQIPNQFKDIAGQEDNDPNSPKSRAFKEYIKRFGINLKGDVSANTAQALLPAVYKQFEGEQNRQLKQAITQQTLAEKEHTAQEANSTRQLLGQLALQGKQYAADKSLEGRQKSLGITQDKFDATQQAAAQKGLNTDKNYLKYAGQVEEANQARNLVDDAVQNGGESAKALGVYLARYATGGQRLSVPEIQALGGSVGSWDQRIKNWASQVATGKITPDQAGAIKRFIDVTSKTAADSKRNIELDRAHKYQQLKHGKISEGDAYQALTGNTLAPAAPTASSSQYTPDVVQYAQEHGITPEQANQIKISRTQGQ